MKKILALLLIFMLTLSMAACGTPDPSPTEAPAETVPPTEYLPYEGETLTVLYMTGPQADAARDMVPEFEEATGAKVVVMDYDQEELQEQVLLDLVSYIGTYDVINIDAQWVGEFSLYLESLESYISNDNYDMSVWIENVLANSGQWQESIVGIPTSCMPHVFAYRTDLLPNGIPETWNEYRKVLSPLNKPTKGMYGIAAAKAPEGLIDLFNRVLWSMGGNWADEDWNVTINCQETRTALAHLNATRKMSDPACTEWTNEDALQAFLDGTAVVCETFELADLLMKADDPEQSQIVGNWALARIPHDKTGMTTMSAWTASIPVGSNNKDLAWEWIKMYTSYDKQNQFYDSYGIFSPRKAFWEQDKVSDLSILHDALETANIAWRIPTFQEVEPAITDILSSFFDQKIFQDPAMRKMDTELKDVLEKMPPAEGIKNYNH